MRLPRLSYTPLVALQLLELLSQLLGLLFQLADELSQLALLLFQFAGESFQLPDCANTKQGKITSKDANFVFMIFSAIVSNYQPLTLGACGACRGAPNVVLGSI